MTRQEREADASQGVLRGIRNTLAQAGHFKDHEPLQCAAARCLEVLEGWSAGVPAAVLLEELAEVEHEYGAWGS